MSPTARCRYPLALIALSAVGAVVAGAAADDWPQWRGPTRDGAWRETGLRETLPEGPIQLRWRAPIGSGYSGPTVADKRVYVSDRRLEPEEVERVLCFDAESGALVWSHSYACVYREISYEAGPRCSVLLHAKRAYSLGAMGHLFCFDAATGEVLWKHDLHTEYEIRMPIWGLSATPIIENDLLIVPVCGAHRW